MAIIDIKHKGLKELYINGRSRKVGQSYQANANLIMTFLNGVTKIEDCNGVKNFHALQGNRKNEATKYAMSVSGNYRIIFTFENNDITIEDFTDYH